MQTAIETPARFHPAPAASPEDACDSCLGMDVTLRVRSTGKPVCSYYVVMCCTTQSTELDYTDAAWKYALRDHCVAASNRHDYVFEMH